MCDPADLEAAGFVCAHDSDPASGSPTGLFKSFCVTDTWHVHWWTMATPDLIKYP